MFVESMTFEEIRKEFNKERQALNNKIVHHAGKVIKLMRQTNMSAYDNCFEYLSPSKNHWKYHFKCSDKKYSEFRIDNYCWFLTHHSYAVISYMPQSGQLIYITGHFFTRFQERGKVDKVNMHDLVRTYFDTNARIATQPLSETEPGSGIWKVFVQSKTGVGLGYWHSKPNVVELRTFISNDMLKGTQVELSKYLEERLKIHCVRNSPTDNPLEKAA